MKLAIVASCFGRAGTSALMGTLAQVGYYLGRSLKKNADINNPKGYFELNNQDELLSTVYPNFYWVTGDNNERKDRAPTPKEMSAVFGLARRHLPSFRKFMQREFVDEKLTAIKDIRMLLLPFVQLVQPEIHPKVIVMNRSVYGRALSKLQMLVRLNTNLMDVDRDALVEYIKGWNIWGQCVRENINVPVLDLRFESLMYDTKNAISAVAPFLGIPRIPLDQAARMFVEPGLTRQRASDPHLNLYYGQNGEDRVLWSLFKPGYCGKYVDVGSLDGKVFSNTYSFDLAGWSGLCVEAHSSYISSLCRNRSATVVHAAATSRDSESIDFYAYPRGSLSTIHNEEIQYLQNRFRATSSWEKVSVPGRTVNSMLQEARIDSPIDVVSIDVEGAELDVLQGFDLAKYAPRVMVLEHMTAEKLRSVVQYLKGFGYVPATSISNNTFYCKKEDVATIANANRGAVCPVKTIHPLDR